MRFYYLSYEEEDACLNYRALACHMRRMIHVSTGYMSYEEEDTRHMRRGIHASTTERWHADSKALVPLD